MPSEVRQKMVIGATRLLAKHGLEATSFAEVLELTGAPRGSVYHHFPKGKDEMVAAAIDFAGSLATDALNQQAGASAEQVAEHYFNVWRSVLTRSNFESGCAVLAVTIATESPTLLEHAMVVFRTWRLQLAQLLEQGGVPKKSATPLAITLVAAAEGAVVLSRAEQSLAPFDAVAAQMLEQVRHSTQR